MPEYRRCEKCWRPAFQLPVGTIFVIYPNNMTRQQKEVIAKNEEKIVFNLCIAHIRIFMDWVRGGKIQLPNKIPDNQLTILDEFSSQFPNAREISDKQNKEMKKFMVNP